MDKRLLLTRTMKIMGLIGVLFLFLALTSSLFITDHAKGKHQTSINLTTLRPGNIRHITELTRPVLILYRTPEMMTGLQKAVADLHHPVSTGHHAVTGQPAYLVVETLAYFKTKNGVENHIAIKHLPKTDKPVFCSGKTVQWQGGFTDNAGRDLCFDYAGRVYNYTGYPWLEHIDNLAIPAYDISDDMWLKITLEPR